MTTVLYGTTWDDSTLLEETKQVNLESEKRDGIKRHFRYDWREVGRYNPGYLRFVQSEQQRLGEEHPLFRTQYALLPVARGGGFLSRQQIALMLGEHQRQANPEGKGIHIAGIDLAGEHEPETMGWGGPGGDRVKAHDSSVITIAEVDASDPSQPVLKVAEQYRWTGTPHSQLYTQMTHLLKDVWKCRRIVVDATGIGQPVASFLRKELGSRIIPLVITSRSKSEMGFELLAFINSGRLKLYRQDGSPEYTETLFELETARAQYRPNQTMNFYVDPQDGHDDFLVSLALMVHAARDLSPREARGRLRES